MGLGNLGGMGVGYWEKCQSSPKWDVLRDHPSRFPDLTGVSPCHLRGCCVTSLEFKAYGAVHQVGPCSPRITWIVREPAGPYRL